jgi:hypothetical protein
MPANLASRVRPFAWVAILLSGCGPRGHTSASPGGVPTATTARDGAATASPVDSPERPEPTEPILPVEPTDSAQADPAPSGPAAPTSPPKSTAKKERVGHEVVYRVSPDGMVILALDAQFHPSAKVRRVQGGYVVSVSVEVEAKTPIELLGGKSGPLSLSARVRRPTEEFHHDERGDSKMISLAAGETRKFERSFPSLPVKPLARSQEAELRFGLWGLGRDEEDRLPVNKFFTVKVIVDAKGARATVEAPAGTASDE